MNGMVAEISVNKLLPTEIDFSDLLKSFQRTMAADPAFAWTWHCAIAMTIIDEGVDHDRAHRAAKRFMKLAFDVDTAPPT